LDVHRVHQRDAPPDELVEAVADLLAQPLVHPVEGVLRAIDPCEVVDHLVLDPVRDPALDLLGVLEEVEGAVLEHIGVTTRVRLGRLHRRAPVTAPPVVVQRRVDEGDLGCSAMSRYFASRWASSKTGRTRSSKLSPDARSTGTRRQDEAMCMWKLRGNRSRSTVRFPCAKRKRRACRSPRSGSSSQ